MLSTKFLASEATRINETTESGVGVMEFVKSVLSNVNKVFGGINNLDIFYDHDNCVYKIVDRGFPLPSAKFPIINVTGLNNTVSELKVQSKISSNISSQISIAAQGHSGTYGENLKAMLQWNAGALDRHINQLYLGDISGKGKFDPMPVPVQLSFKMKGISGIKIASTFKINKLVLPAKYHKYAFIVTGVDHEIGTDNRWYTTVTANFYATGL
jgi:hypothetical protein